MLSLFILLKLFQLWPLGVLLGWLLCPFDMPHFFEHFLTFCHYKMPKYSLILYFPCPSPGINHFYKESWFLLLENDSYIQDLDAGPHCHCGIRLLGPLIEQNLEIPICTHTYIYFGIYLKLLLISNL